MTGDPAHVLVVDDDARLRELLRRYLTEHGFRVTAAADTREARLRLADLAFDLIVLDVMLPEESGLELTHDLRRSSQVPILLLTAMGEVDDRIRGLESGADDYLTKPFEPRELVLRMRTILKRAAPLPAKPAVVRLGDVVFEPGRQALRRGETLIHLTQAEAALLTVLAERPGVTLTRDDLSAAGIAASQARTVDVQVTRLRRKIEPDPKFPRYLQTVRGKGYVLQPD
ncbi:MAG TPA: response regulator transcription factor [Candidatus Sulfotelmatobacter sp.]|nr:response regulator transcription factor [Candidatus Sulfotelmatobacter sp.]